MSVPARQHCPLLRAESPAVLAAAGAGQGGCAGGVVAVAGGGVLGQPRVGGEGLGVEAGRGGGPVRELADPQQGQSLVVVAGLVRAPRGRPAGRGGSGPRPRGGARGGSSRPDRVPDSPSSRGPGRPPRASSGLPRPPASVQGHGEDEAGGRPEHAGRVPSHRRDRPVEPPLAVFRQAQGEQEAGVVPWYFDGRRPRPARRGRRPGAVSSSAAGRSRQARAVRSATCGSVVAPNFVQQGLPGAAVFVLLAEEEAEFGIAVPGVVPGRVGLEGLPPGDARLVPRPSRNRVARRPILGLPSFGSSAMACRNPRRPRRSRPWPPGRRQRRQWTHGALGEVAEAARAHARWPRRAGPDWARSWRGCRRRAGPSGRGPRPAILARRPPRPPDAAQRHAEIVAAEGRPRADGHRRLIVAGRLGRAFFASKHAGQREVGPEVAGVRLLDPPQERYRVVRSSAFARFASASSSGTRRRPGPPAITSARAAWSGRVVRVAGAVAPPRRVRVGSPRHRQQPAPARRPRGVVEAQWSRAATRALRIFDAFSFAATTSGSSSTRPSPAWANAASYSSSSRAAASPPAHGRWHDAVGWRPASPPGPGRGPPVPGGGAARPTRRVAQPALRPLQRGAGLGPGRCLQQPVHLPQVVVRGRLRGRPLARHLVRRLARSRISHSPPPTSVDGQQRAGRDRRRERRPAPDPPGQPLQPALGPRRDRLAPEEAPEVLRQRGGAWRSGAAAPCAGTSGRSVSRSRGTLALSRDGGDRVLRDDLLHRLRRRLRPERRPAREQLVEDRPQRVDVRGRPDLARPALGLLGGHVARRPHRGAGLGQRRTRPPAAGPARSR